MRHLQRLYDDLVADDRSKERPARQAVRQEAAGSDQGIYFWGGVGRGKTYLVDTFFDALPFEQKMRTHFHRFMKRVHEEMKPSRARRTR